MNTIKEQLVEVTYAWCTGSTFEQICKMSDSFEGSIIRTLRRLDELLKQMDNAAKVIGNQVNYMRDLGPFREIPVGLKEPQERNSLRSIVIPLMCMVFVTSIDFRSLFCIINYSMSKSKPKDKKNENQNMYALAHSATRRNWRTSAGKSWMRPSRSANCRNDWIGCTGLLTQNH